MVTIVIPKKKYQELLEKAMRYEYLCQIMRKDIFASPPTKNVQKVMSAFRKTKKYDQQFLKSLEGGLKRSSFFSEKK